MQGKKQVSDPVLTAGQIGAVAKLKETLTGDTLCAETQPIILEFAKFADPVMSYAIEPKSRGDEDKVSIGVHKLLEEDPTLKFAFDEQTKEMVLSGMGQVHLEVTHREAQAEVRRRREDEDPQGPLQGDRPRPGEAPRASTRSRPAATASTATPGSRSSRCRAGRASNSWTRSWAA